MRDGNADYDNSGIYIEGTNYTISGNRFTTTPNPYREARACMEGHGGPAEIFNNSATGYQTLVNIVGSQFEDGTLQRHHLPRQCRQGCAHRHHALADEDRHPQECHRNE